MICEKLKLTNFGRHKSLEMDADCPVVGLLGVNGSGKSTVLDALEFAITGETRDSLPTYVHNFDGNAKVELTFRKNGRHGYIFRQFGSTAKRRLEWDGKEYTRAADVDNIMATIFGADKRAIANAVFINQGTLEKILFPERESDRKEMFIRLVNMSFCAQRAKILDGKIKKLELTIIDLAPAILATSIQRDALANEVLLAKSALENLRDYTGEIVFCDAFSANEEHLKRVTASLGQVQNSQSINQGNIQRILDTWKCNIYEDAILHRADLQAQMVSATNDLNFFNTVASEITHLDRVNREIGEANAKILKATERLKELNPGNLTLEQIKTNFDIAVRELETHAYVVQANSSLASWKQRVSMLKEEFSKLIKPDQPESALAEMRLRYAKNKAAEDRFGAMVETQNRIAACLGEKAGEATECPDCGLKLLEPHQLSMSALAAVESDWYAMQQENKCLLASVRSLEEMWNEWNGLLSRYSSDIHAAEQQVLDIGAQLMANTPSMNKEEAQTMYDKANEQRQQLPQVQRELAQAGKDLRTKMLERSNYKLAIQHSGDRSEFTMMKGQALAHDLNLKKSSAETFEPIFNQLRDLVTMDTSYREQLERLLNEKAQLENYMESPMPSIIVQMVVEKGPNLEAVRAELNSRQAARQIGLGKLDQANQSYDRVNREFQDLKRRSESDVEKRKLIDDLKKLKEVLSDDGLPMAVVRYHFQHLAAMTQESLTKLNANFAIMVDPNQELGFKFVRMDDAEQFELPMNKLSGGQRVRLCVAFLLAVQQRLVKEVGLLVLDEISTHVDEEGIDSMVDLFRNFNGQLKNSEMQVWIVDHHPKIETCLSKCVKLSTAGKVE